jgi:hypothetical protein
MWHCWKSLAILNPGKSVVPPTRVVSKQESRASCVDRKFRTSVRNAREALVPSTRESDYFQDTG